MLDVSMNVFVAVLGGYFVTSLFFLKNPTLIHRRKRIRFTCKHISHRGGAGESYENTLTAFKRAVSLGTDMLELDCQLTKDNQVVVCHDNNLLRCTGVNRNISDIEFKDLPLLKTALPIDFDAGVFFTGSGLEEERQIPLLDDVFKNFPDVPINIDIKTNDDLLIREVDRLITSYNREEITVWGNFSDEITNKCYLQNPRVNLLFSLRKVVQLIFLFYSGLLPFFPLKETHLEIFKPSIYLRSVWRNDKKKDAGSFFIFLPSFLVSTMDTLLMRRSLFEHLRKRGIETYVWVLNYESDFKKVFDLGVSGIMTDYPTRLQKFLKENPAYGWKLTKTPVL